MRMRGSSLRNIEDMPYPDEMFVSNFGNRLLYDELYYDPSKLQREYVHLHSRLPLEQKGVRDTIMDSVEIDRSLRDVLHKLKHDTMDSPFDNMTVIFGGNFRQVVPANMRLTDIVGASLKESYLWDHCKVLRLTANMRLTICCRPEDVNEIKDFSKWILKPRYGNLRDTNDGEAKIEIPNEMLIKDSSDLVGSFIDFTYPNMLDNLDDNKYFT
ncbi:ATP-dependent DNA helicase PIF1-like protein [Tanacetum coccineum]